VRDVWVFLDESGTHARAERLLVGAVVAPDREAVESAVVHAFADVASQIANWETGEEIEAFIARGFHFTQDNVSVRSEFVRELSTMNIRIHVAYSASGTGHAGALGPPRCITNLLAASFSATGIARSTLSSRRRQG
jgi:hypothetical protein